MDTTTQKSGKSQRQALWNIAAPFAKWLNTEVGLDVIKWPKARDPKQQARAERIYAREARAEVLARDLLRRLVGLTVDLTRDLQQQKRRHLRSEIVLKYSPQIETVLKRIAEQGPTRPHLDDDSAIWEGIVEYRDRPCSGRRVSEWSLGYLKAKAVADRMEQFRWLSAERAFATFRRCALSTCNKYFFPLRPERRYCSDRCQKKDYGQGEQQAEQNKAYQRVYYLLNKTRDLAKLADVNADHQKKYDHAKKALKLAEAKLKALKRG